MPTGDPHFPGNCWCGANHAADDYRLGFEDGRRSVDPQPDTASRELREERVRRFIDAEVRDRTALLDARLVEVAHRPCAYCGSSWGPDMARQGGTP